MTAASLSSALKAEAARIGFAACGIARADAAPLSGERLRAWLRDGAHGDMIWMETRADQRGAPTALWPEVRSVVALGLSYAPAHDPLLLADEGEAGRISVYAQGADYHDLVKRKLKELARWMVGAAGGDLKVFVDTAPVMEKPLAEAAGLGWQGKHTNLVSRDHGSWLFLGAIFTTLELEPDRPGVQTCGSCDACQRACPTGAFPAPFRLDARRCISYLTIEHKGAIPDELRAGIGNRIYGCDDCLAVCPWNKFADAAAANLAFAPRAELTAPMLADLLALDDAGFRQLFAGSPIKRIGRDRMIRNCLIAAGNSGSERLAKSVLPHLDDPNPVVRGAAIWALANLDRTMMDAERAVRLGAEADESVRLEWANA
jgi:epoxyqueuosine reductase